ncbi:MAG: hypothetical protein ACYDAE_17300 [Steroidobacteraceae bacterium]
MSLVVPAGKPSYDGKYHTRYVAGNAPALLLNFGNVNYYDPQMMFLNVFKQAGSNFGFTPWGCWNSSDQPTNEEMYLSQILDSDGNVTTLTLPSPPAGGQRFTRLSTGVFINMTLAPGAAYIYPPGNRNLAWQGKVTFIAQGDLTVPAQTLPAGITVNGLSGAIAAQGANATIVSTNAWGTTNTVVVTVASPSAAGMRITLTAVPDNTNYPKLWSLVETAYATQYAGGQVFHPNFLQWVDAFPIAIMRFMQSLNGIGQIQSTQYVFNVFTFTSDPQAGDTTETLSTPWLHASGTYPISLANGQVVNGTFTAGSATVPLAASVTSNCSNANAALSMQFASAPVAGQALPNLAGPWLNPSGTYRLTLTSGETISCTMTAGSPVVAGADPTVTCTGAYYYYFVYENWEKRPQVTNFSYGGGSGIPYEIAIDLAKLEGSDAFLSIPASYQSADWQSFASMCQANIATGQRIIPEWMNEVWNGAYTALGYVIARSSFTWGSANSDGASYYGMIVCEMLQTFNTAVGNPAFDEIFVGGLGSQAANTAFVNDAITAPAWVAHGGGTAPWTLLSGGGKKLIKAVWPAPYYGNGTFLAADVTHATGTGDTSGALIASLTQNPVNGYSFTANNFGGGPLPPNGWFQIAVGWINNHVALLSQYGAPWIICYEGTNTFLDVNNTHGQESIINAMMRDPRMTAAEQAYYEAMRNAGCNVVPMYTFCYPYGASGAWGSIESTMQPISPTTSAPARWQAMLAEFAGAL